MWYVLALKRFQSLPGVILPPLNHQLMSGVGVIERVLRKRRCFYDVQQCSLARKRSATAATYGHTSQTSIRKIDWKTTCWIVICLGAFDSV